MSAEAKTKKIVDGYEQLEHPEIKPGMKGYSNGFVDKSAVVVDMNENKVKTLTLLGKAAGFLAIIASKTDMIPEKYAWAGVILMLLSSLTKDAFMKLGDLWDNGKLDNSFTGTGADNSK